MRQQFKAPGAGMPLAVHDVLRIPLPGASRAAVLPLRRTPLSTPSSGRRSVTPIAAPSAPSDAPLATSRADFPRPDVRFPASVVAFTCWSACGRRRPMDRSRCDMNSDATRGMRRDRSERPASTPGEHGRSGTTCAPTTWIPHAATATPSEFATTTRRAARHPRAIHPSPASVSASLARAVGQPEQDPVALASLRSCAGRKHYALASTRSHSGRPCP